MAENVIELQGIDGVLDMLQKLPPEVVSTSRGPLQKWLRRGGLVFKKAAVANLRAMQSGEATGLLAKSIIVKRAKAPTGTKGERFLMSVRKNEYPNRKSGDKANTRAVMQWFEYGTSKQPARHPIRSAFESNAASVIQLIEQGVAADVEALAQKYLST